MDDFLKEKYENVILEKRSDGTVSFRKVTNGDRIRALAAVQTVKHGKWLSKEYMYGDPDVGIEDMWIDRLAEQSDYYAYCSICGKDAGYTAEGSLILSNYCQNCGAKMDGETNG